ncbi:hypothetical protein LBMAG56_21740 [Verrucomicrobiota bacterium]|nr:hypothetical protein LBMAG56_21740 [Verrucomicrobiota bacterium]
MSKGNVPAAIRLRGVRQNNLQGFDLDLPLGRLVVITGLSGSGKSSLAFDTLFAEGQRRYIETFSPYARQFFDRMDKPRVDSIEGIPPAIAIEQRNSVKSTRSTVGTMTELCDYLKLLWPHLAQLRCRQCAQTVRKEPPQTVWETLRRELPDRAEVLITFTLPLSEKLALAESCELLARQGYQRVLLTGIVLRLDEALPRLQSAPPRSLVVVQDRLRLTTATRARFVEACEQAYHFGKGKLTIHELPAALPITDHASRITPPPSAALPITDHASRITHRDPSPAPPRIHPFSAGFHCAPCDLDYREPTPALFSFNHPVGACPACRGFGRTISIDYDLAVPDRTKTIAEGVVRPWQTGTGAESQADLLKFCKTRRVPVNVPFQQLPQAQQDWVINGDPGYGTDAAHEWPRAWYGVKGYFRWLESKSYKMHVRVLLSRYRSYTTCAACHGRRFQPEALLYTVRLAPGFTGGQPATGTAGTGSLPVPAGYQPDGMEGTPPTENNAPINPSAPLLPRGKLPRGTGRLPVPPNAAHAAASAPPTTPAELTLADFYALPVDTALACIDALAARLSASDAVGPGERRPLAGPVRRPAEPLDQSVTPNTLLSAPPSAAPARSAHSELAVILGEVRARLGYLVEVGLGYLTLDRPTRTLSGGETERVNLTTCLGTRLVNTLFVLDEPSVGLHPRDTQRLVRILHKLRDAGNSVVVVEHEASVMRAADQIVDLGPGHGESGGRVVFQGPYADILKCPTSLTGQYLSGAKIIPTPARRPVTTGRTASVPMLKITNARRHNLRGLDVEIPLGRFVVLTGVSGSGKTTLAREVLLPALQAKLKATATPARPPGDALETGDDRGTNRDGAGAGASADADDQPDSPGPQSATLTGHEHLGAVVLVDQSPLGKTPRSNPAVYIGAFEDIRELFATCETARQRGLGASAFSFNSAQGQCERCRGAGFEKIEMQFLSDIFIRCPDCHGRRYREHILEVKLTPPASAGGAPSIARHDAGDAPAGRAPAGRAMLGAPVPRDEKSTAKRRSSPRPSPPAAGGEEAGTKAPHQPTRHVVGATPCSLSIADLLDATVDDSLLFLAAFTESKPAARAARKLQLLQETGLGYLRLGQPINTLSGGESQRLKLVSHLAETAAAPARVAADVRRRIGPHPHDAPSASSPRRLPTSAASRPTLFVFDEPTTGLHFDDVRVLLAVFQRLVDAGHSVLVIEHNLDVIQHADWVIDLGPEAGARGGELVIAGGPETIAACPASHTGAALRSVAVGHGSLML